MFICRGHSTVFVYGTYGSRFAGMLGGGFQQYVALVAGIVIRVSITYEIMRKWTPMMNSAYTDARELDLRRGIHRPYHV
jgi:hypothetical protein